MDKVQSQLMTSVISGKELLSGTWKLTWQTKKFLAIEISEKTRERLLMLLRAVKIFWLLYRLVEVKVSLSSWRQSLVKESL